MQRIRKKDVNMAEKIKVLFDTDIGSDIDDAVCLAYLLRQPRCELMGITTVTGEPIQRAMLASAVCKAVGRDDIPIHPGTEKPFLISQQQPKAPQAACLPHWPHRTDFEPNSAVEFMRKVIRAHPKQITLLAVGPMTNVGLLFATDPEIPSLLKQLVLMCGVFTNQLPRVGPKEWNAIGDPHATAIVYAAPVRPHLSVGLDVTVQCNMIADEVRKRFKTPPLNVVLDYAEVWFHDRKVITFHDPLAGTLIFQPDICQYAEGKVDVELASPRLMGMTHWTPNAGEKPHKIAIHVDPTRFFDHYFGVTG